MTAAATPRPQRGGTGQEGLRPAFESSASIVRTDEVVGLAAAGAATALALSSTGSMLVAAVLLGVSTRSRWSTLAAVLATAAVSVRFSTAVFDDVAGIQSVLGAAGTVGPPVAAASAWFGAVAVLLAVRSGAGSGVVRHAPAIAGGALAAAIVAGPGPGGELAVRVVATIVAIAIGVVLARTDDHDRMVRLRTVGAVVAGLGSVALASWPG